MFDDEPLAIARLLRAAERSVVAIDHRTVADAVSPEDLDTVAMAAGDWASWEHWASLVRRLRAKGDHGWLPSVLSWMKAPPFVVTSFVGREPIRAGAMPQRYVETHGSIERLVCTRACGSAPPSIANDDLNASAKKLIAQFGRCKACKAPVVPSVGQPSALHRSVQYANDQALDAWRSERGRSIVLLITQPGSLDEQAVRLAQVAGAATIRPSTPMGAWVKKVDHALVSLSWGGPSAIPVSLSR